MLKTLTAIGISAAIVFAPLAAIAQTDTTAPAGAAAPAATDNMAPAKPDEGEAQEAHGGKKARSRRRMTLRLPLRPKRRRAKSQRTHSRRNEPPHPTDGAVFCVHGPVASAAPACMANSRGL